MLRLRHGMGGKRSREFVVCMKKEKYNSNCLLRCIAAPAEDIKTRGWVGGLPSSGRPQGFYREETGMGKVKADWL